MTRAYNNSLLARNINISGINTIVTGLLISDSGNFVNELRVNNIDVSLDGHHHFAADIVDLGSAVSGYAPPTTDASLLTTGILADSLLSGNVVLTNDSRLTDARAPLSHNHTISEITDFYSTVSGILPVQNIVAGSNINIVSNSGTYTVNNSKTIQKFTARDNHPPASNFATLDTRNSILVLEFDAATEESAYFVGVIDESATLTNGLMVRIWWMGDTATTGNVRWGVEFEKTGTDLDSNSFDTNSQVTSSVNGTSGIESVAEITITTIDSLAAGDRFRLRVYRVAADATNDTMTGDAQLVAVEVRTI